jgi:DNA-binding IclR family transcriptional regulator
LGHGVAILECLDRGTGELTAAQLASRTGMKLSTLYRYLAMLEASGFIQRLTGGKYALGIKLVELGGHVLLRDDVYRFGQPVAEELATELGLDVHLAQLYEGDVLHVGYGGRPARVESRNSLVTTGSKLGQRAPAHCTSLGKALLAYTPTNDVESVIRRFGWRPMTTNSIRTFARLEKELNAVRSRGFAIDREEKASGIYCIAVPVFGRNRQAACSISATGPAGILKISRNIDRISELVTRYADLLGRGLTPR